LTRGTLLLNNQGSRVDACERVPGQADDIVRNPPQGMLQVGGIAMRPNQQHGNRARLGFERLESRTMLAGDVFVFMDRGGNLQIFGDNRANGIQIDQFGEITVRGIDAGGSATRVNGVANGTVEFEVTGEGDIKVHLRGGNDIVRVGERSDDVNASDDLEIDTGHGNDQILITGDTNIGDDLEIETGRGADVVDARNVDVADDMHVSTGADDDIVRLLAVRISDDTRVNTGDGADRIYSNFESTFGGSLRIDMGRGDDFLQLTGSKFEGPVHVNMDRGNDGLCLETSQFASENTIFKGGRGDRDTWAINATTFAGEPLLGDITPGFEFEFDDCSFFSQWDCFCTV
jgi:hypothetical protein